MTRFKLAAVVFCSVLVVGVAAMANHSWGGYHWARRSNPFTLKLGNNLTSGWQTYLGTASSDWSRSSVLHTSIVGGGVSRSSCPAVNGMVEVCNYTYGGTGWLGIASINITSGSHITSGTVKLNDSYFNQSQYNSAAWRQMVTCQEIGHTFGLDHQDTNFTNLNLGTCMDYTNDPSGTKGTNGSLANTHPNAHDYNELVTIYSHADSTTTVGAPTPLLVAARAEGDDELPAAVVAGRVPTFIEDLDNGEQRLTHIFWVPTGN